MTQFGPDAGIIRQWESKLVRWVVRGRNREEILYDMTAGNWLYEDADRLLRKVVFRQRRKYIITMLVCGFFALLGIGVTIMSLSNPNGGEFYVPIGFTIGFIYALVRLVKIRA